MAIGLIDCNIYYTHKLAHKQDQPTLTTNKWIAPRDLLYSLANGHARRFPAQF
jgi:hypothetical protein